MLGRLLCRVGIHRWTAGSPWNDRGAGNMPYRVKACTRCVPNAVREFWKPLWKQTNGHPQPIGFVVDRAQGRFSS